MLFAAPPGSAVTLALNGTIVAASDTKLTMKVKTAEIFPARATLLGLRKPMTLTLTPDALIAGQGSGKVADHAGALAGRTAIVLTLPARTSLETQAAEDGAFGVARVVLRH